MLWWGLETLISSHTHIWLFLSIYSPPSTPLRSCKLITRAFRDPHFQRSANRHPSMCRMAHQGELKRREDKDSLSLAATGSNQVDTDTFNAKNEFSSQSSEASNGQAASPDTSSSPDSQSTRKSSLTARERLRAARVLSHYNNESKTTKSNIGSKVLEALRESDRGKKKSRLPEAPTNLFDDSKRGMPKPGWTFQFPGGSDLFAIVFSFVFISTVMFATTYIVWKVGAIHFNEY